MVSVEEEMIQKDKETAVLKANHKHQILLNIELERIERCRRAYEGFHNFEVALIKARREKIVLKQVELKRKTGRDMVGENALDLKINPRSYVVMAEGERRRVEKTLRTDLSSPRVETLNSLPERTRGRALFQSGDRQNKVNLKTKDQIVGTKTTTRCPRTTTNNPKSFDATQSRYKRKELRTEQDLVRFPDVTSTHSPNVFTTQTQFQIHPPDSQNISATPTRYSWKLHTARNSRNSKTKSVRSAVKDMSPFDRYRLKLQESEERTRKCKFPFRSISAVDTLHRKGGGNDKIPISYRRVRSADFQ